MALASEIKAILATGWCQADVTWDTAARFLCRGHEDEDTQTFFKQVDQVPQGSILEVSLTGGGHRFARTFGSARTISYLGRANARPVASDAGRSSLNESTPLSLLEDFFRVLPRLGRRRPRC